MKSKLLGLFVTIIGLTVICAILIGAPGIVIYIAIENNLSNALSVWLIFASLVGGGYLSWKGFRIFVNDKKGMAK